MLIAGRVGGSGGGVLASSEVGVVFLSLTLVFGGGAKESSERSSAKIQTHCGKTLNQVKLDTFSPQGMPLGLPASSSLNPIDDRLRRTCTGAPKAACRHCLQVLYASFVFLVFLKWKMEWNGKWDFPVQNPQTVCVNTPRFAKVRQDKLLNFQTRFESGKVHAKEKQGGNTEREMHTRNWRRFMTELVLEASLD